MKDEGNRAWQLLRLGAEMSRLRRGIEVDEQSIQERRKKLADLERSAEALLVEVGIMGKPERKKTA